MKLDTVIQRMPYWYRGGKSVHLESEPGRGKSTTFEAFPDIVGRATNKKLGLIVVNGAHLTVMDVLGFGVPKHYEDHSEMVFTQPFFCRDGRGRRWTEFDGGLMFIDEQDKMDVDVKKLLGEARLSGRFGPHQLPPGWVVWSAGNGRGHRSGSTKQLDHEINRTRWLKVTDDFKSWENWAFANDVMPVTISFAREHTHIVFSEGVPEEQGPWCTPRSLVSSDKYLQMLAADNKGDVPVDPDTVEEIGGDIGDSTAAQYFTHIRMEQELASFEQIVAKPLDVRMPDKPDAMMLLCYKCAHQVDDKTIAPVIKFIDRMPAEFAVTFAHSASVRRPSLIMTDAMDEWTQNNASLMAAITRTK
jgi:MoxR-like ATPase